MPPFPPLWAPGALLGAFVGIVGYQQCLAEMRRVPTAEIDFENIVKSADAGSLKRFMLAELDAQRPECAQVRRSETGAAPDAVIEITKLVFERSCGDKTQIYEVSLHWRVVTMRPDGSGDVHGPRETRFVQISSRGLEAWSASPDRARLEIERVMERIAQWFVRELTTKYSGSRRDPPFLHVPFPGDEPAEPAESGGS
jgi:hypothetical protein